MMETACIVGTLAKGKVVHEGQRPPLQWRSLCGQTMASYEPGFWGDVTCTRCLRARHYRTSLPTHINELDP